MNRKMFKVALATFLACFFLSGPPIFASHDADIFELDGDAVDSSAIAPEDDWSSLNNQYLIGGATSRTADDVGLGDKQFTIGSKDIDQIDQWGWRTSGQTEDKNDIVNSYAAAYVKDGKLYLYMGADRYSSGAGNSNFGFWFFQDEVTVRSTGGFIGSHVPGDLFLTSEFTSGGDVSGIRLYKWVGSGGSHGSLDQIFVNNSTNAQCGSSSSDPACAISNKFNQSAPFTPYSNKVACDPKDNENPADRDPGDPVPANCMPPGSFLEAGIDVSKLGLPGSTCFASFGAETRSSQETTADLADFTLDSLDTCPSVSGKKFHDLNADGDRDTGEPGLSGWEIHLFGTSTSNQAVHEHATTGSDGSWTINTVPGTYTICESQQSGWSQSMPAGNTLCANHGGGAGYSITLTYGQDMSGNDAKLFGNYQPASVVGSKFRDDDADATKDAGESTITGWEIHLFNDPASSSTPAFHAHTMTAANGAYTFSDIRPGSYIICESIRSGWDQSFPTSGYDCGANHAGTMGFGYAITLTSGQRMTNADFGADFGNYQPASISGLKFHDHNANGVKDGTGDEGLAGWEIHIFNTPNTGTTSYHTHTVTAAGGAFNFTGLRPGTYTLCESLSAQSGWRQSYPASGVDCSAHGGGFGQTVTVASAAVVTGKNFGNYQPASISGLKFHDEDADKTKDSTDDLLGGWEVRVYNSSSQLVATTTTAPSTGAYSFTGLNPGTYTVCEVMQTGWYQSVPATGTDCLPLTGTIGNGYVVTLASGEQKNSTNFGADFGNYQKARVSGYKFEDLDANGIFDGSDQKLSNWYIHLFNDSGTVHQHVTTTANGSFVFSDLDPGTYTICEISKNGWSQSTPTGNTYCSAHAGTEAKGYRVTVTSGDVSQTQLIFGNYRKASLSGYKFEDSNADGAFGSGDTKKSGWRIHLLGSSGDTHSTTDSNGVYSFANLDPGTYTVCEEAVSGWNQSAPTSAIASCQAHAGADSNGYTVTLVSGQEVSTGYDFGNYRSGSLRGMKFNDLDADGAARESGEPGLGGWTVTLTGSGNAAGISASTITALDGSYSFNDLKPGTYSVCETQQFGWTQSYPSAGADCAPGKGYTVTMTSGDNSNDALDFGNYQSVGVSGLKYEDDNANGSFDQGETVLSGWRIHLVSASSDSHVLTGTNGAYSFTGLKPDTYTLCEEDRNDWFQSEPGIATAACQAHAGAEANGYSLSLSSGQLVTSGVDFGNYRRASIGGLKFQDENANGVQNSGDAPIPGWEIHLVLGTTDAHALTGSDGRYSFTDLTPGTYTICETLTSGWFQTKPGPTGVDCAGHGGGYGYEITLTSGEDRRGVDFGKDFGNYQPASVAGVKFHDLNANGIKDGSEPNLKDWEIHLFSAGAHEHATTDATGAFSFTGLTPGTTYTICESVTSGWTQSAPATGADCSAHGGGVGYTILPGSGQNLTNRDFGNHSRVSISGIKFHDQNGNGSRDATEPTLQGWEIHLSGAGLHEHTLTDFNGAYSFKGLVAGQTYLVCESTRIDWIQKLPALNTEADCTAHVGAAARGYEVTPVSDQNVTGKDFGNSFVQVLPLLLARTGAEVYIQAMLAMMLLLVGALCMMIARRRDLEASLARVAGQQVE